MNHVTLKKQSKVSYSGLIEQLITFGYVRSPVVVTKGECAVRGSIIDLFAPNHALPIRLEFLGDILESIRSFDPHTQRSVSTIQETDIQEIFLRTDEEEALALENIPKEFFSDITNGSYVVHIDHGIARFKGMARLTIHGFEGEYLELEFQEGDRVYVPLEQFQRVHLYSGIDTSPLLSSLRDKKWDRAKSKARQATENIALELLELFRMRHSQNGFAFREETELQLELERSFPFIETPDQRQAIHEVIQDMETARPMDRLVCGDVGFGKTEVAIRAAYKAVVNGKQVGILVPTTILTVQHYHTFMERLSQLGVNIQFLNRMKSPGEQKTVIKALAAGQIDILIGTHRLLSKDVEFHDLGLIIVDEEQRFGVKQKERLKQLKAQVDVLTLSATPIPRTLYMSITGVRDISIIATPPQERLPVKTLIKSFDWNIIRNAIESEIARNGQVFVLHNRVETIYSFAEKLRSFMPQARFAVAHGQMNPHQLELTILDFYHKNYDVLVTTTIIENGLDMPNVNTIIIDNADKFGLAQLHQLRGRVGRSIIQSYAYLLTHPEKHPTPEGLLRLDALKSFSALGTGYKIAIRDLELRGAGNLLGSEQHGHIVTIGFELFCQLLNESMVRSRGQHYSEPEPLDISRKCTAFIAEDYIDSMEIRIAVYQRISRLHSVEQINPLREELIDRFGPLPEDLDYMLSVIRQQISSRLR